MPRCNLTLKQKCQIIELRKDLSTDQIAKKFHVHSSTILRTLKKKNKILDQAARVNVNFKTVQTNLRGEEHDTLVLEWMKTRQKAGEPLSIKDICDKAVECAKDLDRTIKSKRGWWRRFKIRCNIVKSRVTNKSPGPLAENSPKKDKLNKKTKKPPGKQKKKIGVKASKKGSYTFKIRESLQNTKQTLKSENEPEDEKEANIAH